ncbi:MAG: hypothetical protein Q8N53_20230, partial [Longimicrobiales bacterium]|nr:hypothetical protein [Longimicrobiales bacterium]
SMYAPSYGGGGVAKPGTTVVASYMNGKPLIGFRKESLGQRLVAVAVFPAHEYYGGISGDFYKIWDNALRWAAGGSTPVPPPPSAEIVPSFQLAPLRSRAAAVQPALPSGTRRR